MKNKLKTLSFPFTLKEADPAEPDDTAEPEDGGRGLPDDQPERTLAASDKGSGIFAGYASTWDPDLYDDVIMPGAFADTLAAQYPDGGAKIPIHWQHKEGSPFDVIGETISAIEDDKGLYIEARLDLDTDEGARAYQLLQRGLIHQMSIGFLIEECSYVTDKDSGDWDWDHRQIHKVKLFEISLVQVAGNQSAEIIEVRSANTDAARKDGPTHPAAKTATRVEENTHTSGSGSLRNGKDSDTMDMASQLAAKKQAAATLVAKGADRLTDADYAQLKAINEDIKEIEGNLEAFKQAADSINKVATHTRKEQPMRAKSLGDLYIKGLESKGMSVLDTKHTGFRSAEFKAADTTHQTDETTGGGEGYAPLTTQVDQQGVFAYQRPLTIAALFDQGTMNGSAITYPVYGALEGGAGTVKQGAKKPQLHLPAPEWVTDTLHEIAAYWKISDDMADDVPYVVSEINSHATYDLQLVEETQLLSGDGADTNLTGLLNRSIQTMGKDDDTDADRIFKAFTKVSEATGFPVDAIVINPTDYQAIRLSKDSNGQYYGGGPFNGGEVTVPLWGVNTIVTPAVAAGTVVVGAFKQGGTVFRKGGLVVESSNSNEDDFIYDKIAFRVKERVTLQVKYPKAFVKVTLGAKPTAGKTE